MFTKFHLVWIDQISDLKCAMGILPVDTAVWIHLHPYAHKILSAQLLRTLKGQEIFLLVCNACQIWTLFSFQGPNSVLAGKVLLCMAYLWPLIERSAVNHVGQHNPFNNIKIKLEQSGDVLYDAKGIPVNRDLYVKLWNILRSFKVTLCLLSLHFHTNPLWMRNCGEQSWGVLALQQWPQMTFGT